MKRDYKRNVASPPIVISLLLLLHASSGRRISKTSCGTNAAFYCIATDAILDEIAIFKNVTNDITDCIDFCITVAMCKAINTHKRSDGKMDCHLLQDDHMTKNGKIVSKTGWRLYDTGSSDTNSAVGSNCSSKTVNPCNEGCACVDTCHGYRCDCGEKEVFSSCKVALSQNRMANLNYLIKGENMNGSIQVKCTKNSDGLYVAAIGHSSLPDTYVSGYENCGSYEKTISYAPNKMEDIQAYVNSAASCRQFTKVKCHQSLLLRKSCGYPTSHSGTKLNYWGGGPSDGSGGCACGVTNTCYNTAYKCNCDANVNVLLADEGYLTDKKVLPLVEVRFGDTGSSDEYIYYTLGNLECTEND